MSSTENDADLGEFVPLHCHSEYSSLDGGAKVNDIPERLKELGFKAMALTDHGVMQGLPHFQEKLRSEGIKPILGIEAYLTNDRHDHSRGTPTWHITLLAETQKGYQNLCKLSTWAFLEGRIMTFNRARARADWELMDRYSEGVICLSGCMAGPVMGAIMIDGDLSKAREYLNKLIEIFGRENVYGEIQNAGVEERVPEGSELARKLGRVEVSQTDGNRELAEICAELEIPLVATGDSHYLRPEDAEPHDVMLCIGTGQKKRGERRFSLLPKLYHMRSLDEMREAVGEWPEAISNTVKIAERCSAEIQWGKNLLPRYELPEGFDEARDYLRHLCEQGLEERYPEGDEYREEALERLDFELGVIDRMGYNDYFLITWDLFNEAERRDIPAGPGRGSAAGSLVAYTLDITKMCPLKYKLLFERFLNPDRISPPDIDMDFATAYNGGRDALMEYSFDKYNKQSGSQTAVAQQVTFSRFKAKGALKDSARALAEPTDDGAREALKLGDRLAAMIPDDPKATISSVLADEREGKRLKLAKEGGGIQAEVVNQAAWLEDMIRAYSTHAAAVLIADHDLSDDLPLQQLNSKKPLEIQYEMGHAERIGLLKMDFLVIRNLDVIWDACRKIKHTRGIEIKPYRDIPLTDTPTYETFARGESIGTFQFESGGMSSALREVRPTEFEDLVALVALYRPGPMAHIPTYAARKHGKEPVSYLDPRLEPIQKDSYGLTLYQETSMMIARELAGFTPGQADDLRKAIGKKQHDRMEKLKPMFIKGCEENDVAKEVAEALWADNEAAADYSFNRSHAVCYAYLAYITGYLKTNYPEEYMAALLSSVVGKKDKPAEYLREAKRMGLRVLPPDVNRSLSDFAVMERPADERDPDGPEEQFDILFGMEALRGVGGGVVSEIVAEREARGPFSSMYDLIRRLPKLTKTVIQALIKGGALDSTGDSRKGMFDQSEDALERIRKEIKDKEKVLLKAARESALELTGEKLSSLERKGFDGGVKALAPPKDPDQVSDEELSEAISDALLKGQMTEERAKIKKLLADNPADVEVAGIAAEEGADASDVRKVVEAKAIENVEGSERRQERDGLTKVLVELTRKAVKKTAEDTAEEAGFEEAMAEESDPVILRGEWPEKEKLNLERQMLGIYVSGHPLDEIRRQWAWSVDRGIGQLTDQDITPRDAKGAQLPNIGGVLVGLEKREIRSGVMYKAVLEDLTGAREITIWPDTAKGKEEILEIGEILSFKVQIHEDTFAAQKAEEDEEGGDGDESGKPIQLIASSFARWDPTKSVRVRPRAELQEYLGMSAQDTPPEELEEAVKAAEVAQREMLEAAKSGEAVKSPEERRIVPRKPARRASAQPFVIPVHPEQRSDPEWKKTLQEILDRHASDDGVTVRMMEVKTKKIFATPFKVTVTEELKVEIKTLYEDKAGD